MNVYAGRDASSTSDATSCGSIVAQVHGLVFFRGRDRQSYFLAAHRPRQLISNSQMTETRALVEECSHTGRSGNFMEPSQWWDNREIRQTSPTSPDFKHKISKESLGIEGSYDPGWVKDMFENNVKASTGQAHARGLVKEGRTIGFKSEIKVNASKAQLRKKRVLEGLSLEETLTSMERMPQPPSIPNLTRIVHKCRTLKNLVYTKRLYAYMCKTGLEDHRSLGNYLIPMLVQVGSMGDAEQVFNKLVDRNVYSWTSLISGYIDCGESQHALYLYQKMQEDFVNSDKYTFVAVLKACARLKDAERGRDIHAEIARKGLERESFIGSALVDMYAKCGWLAKAREAFDKLPARDEVLWTALMAGYAEHGLGEEALKCLEEMQLEGLSPNAITFVCSLKACGSIGAIGKGREIHIKIAGKGLERDLFVGSTLVDMYAKCGALADARKVFDKLPGRDEVLWNALMAGYAEHGLGEEALNCLEQMQLEGLPSSAVTFVCTLKACGSIGAIDKGQEIHVEISRKGMEGNLFVGNTLVDMYAKCATIVEAQEAFDNLPVRDTVSWNALMAGYAQLGESEIVFGILERMRGEAVKPDDVTFSTLFGVCSHMGLVDEGQKYFEVMNKNYGVSRTIEHHIGIVDLLGRAGQLDKAVAMVKKMPFEPNIVVWLTLLGACQKWGNVELGRLAFEHAKQFDKKDSAPYVLMSNIYVDAHMKEEEKRIEAESSSMEEARSEFGYQGIYWL